MKRSRYAQAFESMSPSEEQKNKIYNNIIEKAEKKERNKKYTPKLFFRTVPTIAAAAALTAFMSAVIVIAIQSDAVSGGIDKLFEDAGHSHPKVKTQIGSGVSKNVIGNFSIYDIYYSDDKMAVIYELMPNDEVLRNCDTLNAEMTSKVNDRIIGQTKDSATFVKSDDKFIGEMVYDIKSRGEAENVFTLQSEIKNIYGIYNEGGLSGSIFTTDKYKEKFTVSIQTEKAANDAVNEYYPKIYTEAGNFEKITVTPFETVIDMDENCDITLYDQDGIMIRNIHDNVFEPLPMNTEQLNIIVPDKSSHMLISAEFKNPEGFRVLYDTSDNSGIFIKLFINAIKYGQIYASPIFKNTDSTDITAVSNTYIPYSEIPKIYNESDVMDADNFVDAEDFTIKIQNSFIKKNKSQNSKLYVNCIIKNNSRISSTTGFKNFFIIDEDVSPYYLDKQNHYVTCDDKSFAYDKETLSFDAGEEKTVEIEYTILNDDIDDRFYLVTEFRNGNDSINIIKLEPTMSEN